MMDMKCIALFLALATAAHAGDARSARAGQPGHWPRGVVFAAGGGEAMWLGFHLESQPVRVPERVAISPDGKTLAFARKNEVLVGPVPEGPFKAVFTGAKGTFAAVGSFSGAGRWLTFAGAAAPHAVELATRHVIDLPNGHDLDIAADGRIAVASEHGLALLGPGGKAEQWRIGRGEDAVFAQVRFSPDGRWLAVEHRFRQDENLDPGAASVIEVVEAATGRMRLVAPAASGVAGIHWSPGGKEIAYWNEKEGLSVVDVASLKRTQVVPPKYGGDTGGSSELLVPFAWSPDGAAIVFAKLRIPLGRSEDATGHSIAIYAVDVGDRKIWSLTTDAQAKAFRALDTLEIVDLPGLPR
jgi:hypothetical protein